MELINVTSSSISAIGYDVVTSKLVVRFVNGKVYEYKDVPIVVYNHVMTAKSVGKEFYRLVVNNYEYKKV